MQKSLLTCIAVLAAALITQISASPPNIGKNNYACESNSIPQNEKILKLFVQLALHTVNRLIHLKLKENPSSIDYENYAERDSDGIALPILKKIQAPLEDVQNQLGDIDRGEMVASHFSGLRILIERFGTHCQSAQNEQLDTDELIEIASRNGIEEETKSDNEYNEYWKQENDDKSINHLGAMPQSSFMDTDVTTQANSKVSFPESPLIPPEEEIVIQTSMDEDVNPENRVLFSRKKNKYVSPKRSLARSMDINTISTEMINNAIAEPGIVTMQQYQYSRSDRGAGDLADDGGILLFFQNPDVNGAGVETVAEGMETNHRDADGDQSYQTLPDTHIMNQKADSASSTAEVIIKKINTKDEENSMIPGARWQSVGLGGMTRKAIKASGSGINAKLRNSGGTWNDGIVSRKKRSSQKFRHLEQIGESKNEDLGFKLRLDKERKKCFLAKANGTDVQSLDQATVEASHHSSEATERKVAKQKGGNKREISASRSVDYKNFDQTGISLSKNLEAGVKVNGELGVNLQSSGAAGVSEAKNNRGALEGVSSIGGIPEQNRVNQGGILLSGSTGAGINYSDKFSLNLQHGDSENLSQSENDQDTSEGGDSEFPHFGTNQDYLQSKDPGFSQSGNNQGLSSTAGGTEHKDQVTGQGVGISLGESVSAGINLGGQLGVNMQTGGGLGGLGVSGSVQKQVALDGAIKGSLIAQGTAAGSTLLESGKNLARVGKGILEKNLNFLQNLTGK